MADDIGTEKPEPAPEASVQEASPPYDGGLPAEEASTTARDGPGAGVWAGIAVGVVVLVVAAAALGYYIGRGNDSGVTTTGGTGDTARTDQELCTELLGALREIAASPNPTDVSVPAASMRTHVAGLLSDAPQSATTTSVQGAYDAARDLATGDPATVAVLRTSYEEKVAIAQYQCDKIATWNWPAT